jgi:hypothetical protein
VRTGETASRNNASLMVLVKGDTKHKTEKEEEEEEVESEEEDEEEEG